MGLDVFSLDWKSAFSIAVSAAVFTLLKTVAAVKFTGDTVSPASFVKVHPPEQPALDPQDPAGV